MTTLTKVRRIQEVLDAGDLDLLANGLARLGIGKRLSVVKAVVVGLAATASPDITSAAVKAAATISGITLGTGENLPAIAQVVGLRIAASGTATSLGAYIVSDVGATPIIPPGGAGAAVGIARLSDDGKTITFPNTVTAFTIIYIPRVGDTQDQWETPPA